MRDKPLANLESKLERLIEGAFSHLFGRFVRAQDIALQLTRAMENGLRTNTHQDPRPIAPDTFHIYLNPKTMNRLLSHHPKLSATLGEYMVELATSSGYRLEQQPFINLLSDDNLSTEHLRVNATHAQDVANSTNILKKVKVSQPENLPQNPQLVINGRNIPLQEPLINIGRSLDSDIILDDAHASRQHAQLRLRFGNYTLFDAQSRAGTFVNDIRVTQYDLKSGDVIRLGETRIVYLEDEPDSHDTTSHFEAISGDGDE